jgi:hypothetical protein
MYTRQRTGAVLTLGLLMLTACGNASEDMPAPETGSGIVTETGVLLDVADGTGSTVELALMTGAVLDVTGAKAGTYISLLLNGPTAAVGGPRPTGTLGVFVSLYLAQGAFVPVMAASHGIDVLHQIILGQTTPESSETFSLLKEFGSVLQADVVDLLNRSSNREVALDQYLRSLRNIMELAQRKINELVALEESLAQRQRDERTVVRDMERMIQTALRDEDYELAGEKQEELVPAKSSLAAVETELEQTQDILEPYEKLMEIAVERADAIEKNRAIMIAGLKVIEVPGVDDLELIQDESSWRSRILPGNRVSPLSPQN